MNKPRILKGVKSSFLNNNNRFNQVGFGRLFSVYQASLSVSKDDIETELPNMIYLIKKNSNVMIYSLIKQKGDKDEHKYLLLAKKNQKTRFSPTSFSCCHMIDSSLVPWYDKVNLMRKGLFHCIGDKHISYPSVNFGSSIKITKDNQRTVSFVNFFLKETAGGRVAAFPSVSTYKKLKQKEFDAMSEKELKELKRYTIEKRKSIPEEYYRRCDDGMWVGSGYDNKKECMQAVSSDVEKEKQRAYYLLHLVNMFNKTFGDNGKYGSIYHIEFDDFKYDVERVHDDEDVKTEKNDVISFIKQNSDYVQIYISPEINQEYLQGALDKWIENRAKKKPEPKPLSDAIKLLFEPDCFFKVIIECVKSSPGLNVKLVTDLNELDDNPIMGIIMNESWYEEKEKDEKNILYKKFNHVQIVDVQNLIKILKKNSKNISNLKKQFNTILSRCLVELTSKLSVSRRSVLGIEHLYAIDKKSDDFLFLTGSKKKVPNNDKMVMCYDALIYSKGSLKFYHNEMYPSSIIELDELGDFSDELMDDVESFDKRFMCVVQYKRDDSMNIVNCSYSFIASEGVLVVPDAIYEKHVQYDINRKKSFTLEQIKKIVSMTNKEKPSYENKLNAMIQRMESSGRLFFTYDDFSIEKEDGKKDKINHKCKKFYENISRELLGGSKFKFDSDDLKLSFQNSYLNIQDSFYSCGAVKGGKFNEAAKFVNIRELVASDDDIKKVIFDMTACYTLRGDKSATVYPAPFKLLREYVSRQEVLK